MTHADFLQAILADPDDDTPRLIYADWLEEQGDPRGEFIRVQCELAKTELTKEVRQSLEARERTLKAEFGAAWRALLAERIQIAHLPLNHLKQLELEERHRRLRDPDGWQWLRESKPLPSGISTIEFARGMPETVCVSHWVVFFSFADSWLRVLPLQGLRVERLSPSQIKELFEWPSLIRFKYVGMSSCELTPAGMKRLSNSPYLTSIQKLEITDMEFGREGIEALLQSPHLTSLNDLTFCRSLRTDDLVLFIGSPRANNLKRLNLYGCRIGDEAARALADCPNLTKLQVLDLRRCDEMSRRGRDLLRRRLGKRIQLLMKGW